MRLTNLINPLPEGGSATTTNRVVALWCAMRITPDKVVASGASNTGSVTTVAQRFEGWLDKADNDEDTYIRRALLVMVCDKADETTPDDRIRTFVKELHRHVRRH
jgi:hypothetical protein